MQKTSLDHYEQVLLPLLSALDKRVLDELSEVVKEVDSLVEIIAFAELTPAEQEEFEMAYWAWWEQIKRKVLQNHF